MAFEVFSDVFIIFLFHRFLFKNFLRIFYTIFVSFIGFRFFRKDSGSFLGFSRGFS